MPMGIIGVSHLTTDWQGIISCPGNTILRPTGARIMMMAQMSHHVREKKLGIVQGDQQLRWEQSRAARVLEMKCDVCGHIVRMDLIVTWHDAGLK